MVHVASKTITIVTSVNTDYQTNMINEEKLEISQELPKCDTDMKWANATGKMMSIDMRQHCHKPSICKKMQYLEMQYRGVQ